MDSAHSQIPGTHVMYTCDGGPYFLCDNRSLSLVTTLTIFALLPKVCSLQIWRPITALFYYPIAYGTMVQYFVMFYYLFKYSKRLETGTAYCVRFKCKMIAKTCCIPFTVGVFYGRPADYLFMLIFNWLGIIVRIVVQWFSGGRGR